MNAAEANPAVIKNGPIAVFDEALDSIQSTTKWIVGGAAATVGVLLAGLQLKDLGAVREDSALQLGVGIVGCVIAVVGAGFILIAASRVLIMGGLTLGALAHREINVLTKYANQMPAGKRISDFDPLLSWIDDHRNELLPHATRQILDFKRVYQDLSAALSQVRQGHEATVDGVTYGTDERSIARLQAMVEEYHLKADTLLDAAHLFLAREAFQRLLRMLWVSGTLTVAGLLAFVLATTRSQAVVVSAPLPVEVLIRQDVSQDVLALNNLAATCAGKTVTGVAIGGNYAEPVVVTTAVPGCPATRVKISGDIGLAIPQVARPATASPSPQQT